MSIAMSLFLYRKALPSAKPPLRPYLEKMSSPSQSPDPGFLEYVKQQVPRMFRHAWDRTSYPSACLRTVVPVKSCEQRSLSKGGSRLEVFTRYGGPMAHHDFVMELLTREAPVRLLPSRVTAVETGGKQRIVSIADVQMNLFRPLHTAIYDHLSQFSWLLRGDAKPSKFKDEFTLVHGEVFTSGDYESATDNLNQGVQELILSLILDNTVAVPKGILDSACDTLRMSLYDREDPDLIYHQHRGQLMGNLLSFPLLCIVNYLAFRYYSGTSGRQGSRCFAPVKVNGDDIVFRSTPEVSSRWMKGVVGSGLVLSKGKTMVHGTYFSLNSCLFKARPLDVFIVPCIRSTAFGFCPSGQGVESLAGRWRASFPGFFGNRRTLLRVDWLKWNRKWIVASRRSLSRGLGLNVNESEVRSAGLWSRECFYLSMARETPLPVKRSVLDQVLKVPHDWEPRRVEKITKKMRKESLGLAGAFIECAWSDVRGIFADSDYRDRVDDAPNWLGDLRDSRRSSRLLGLSKRNSRRFLSPRSQFPLSKWWRSVRFTVWRPTVDPCLQQLSENEVVRFESDHVVPSQVPISPSAGRWRRGVLFVPALCDES